MLQPSNRHLGIIMDWIILIISGLCEVGFAFWRLLFITTLIASIVGLKIIS